MKTGPNIANIAALIGDPARANMLTAMMSGKALTVSELAGEAGVTVQTASSHLAKLQGSGLLRPRKEGRHKYYTLASDDVAGVLEGLMGLAAGCGHMRTRTGPKDAELRHARVCYNHLAGDRGTQMFDSLVRDGHLQLSSDLPRLTESGRRLMNELQVDLLELEASKTPLCRECLDWSERRSHLAGSLGRALLARFEALNWVKRVPNSRVVRFTSTGQIEFRELFGMSANG